MSTPQRNSACVVPVDPSTADVLRHQTLVVLEANHYYFEEILEFGPEAQHALSVIYRDAFAVLDTIGWRRPEEPITVDVPFTAGFIEQLHRRRFGLGHTNIDRISQETWDQAVVDRDREAAITPSTASSHRSRRRTRGRPPRPPAPSPGSRHRAAATAAREPL